MHQFHYRVNRVDLEPALTEVGAVGVFMMIVLKQLAQHQKVEWRGVPGFIFIVEIGIAVFMPAPVYDSAVDGPHHKMDSQ